MDFHWDNLRVQKDFRFRCSDFFQLIFQCRDLVSFATELLSSVSFVLMMASLRSAPTLSFILFSRYVASSRFYQLPVLFPIRIPHCLRTMNLPKLVPRPLVYIVHGVVGRFPPKMDEQPVAFAMIIFSPYIWESSLRYGVSPHPAQVPENSKSGCNNCVPLTVFWFTRERSISGARKNSQFSFSFSSSASLSTMLMALCPGSFLLSTGQNSTQRLVTGTILYRNLESIRFISFTNSFPIGSICINPSGAEDKFDLSYTLARIAACGQIR